MRGSQVGGQVDRRAEPRATRRPPRALGVDGRRTAPDRPPGRRPEPGPAGPRRVPGRRWTRRPAGRTRRRPAPARPGRRQGQLQVVAHEHASHTGPLQGPPVGSNGPRPRAVRPTPSETRTVASTSTPGGDRPVAAARPPGGRGGTCWWPGSCWPTWRRAGWSWPWGSGSPAGLAGPAPGAAGRGHQRHRRLERALRGRALRTPPVSERVATVRALALNLGIVAVLAGVQTGRSGLAAAGAGLVGVVVLGHGLSLASRIGRPCRPGCR